MIVTWLTEHAWWIMTGSAVMFLTGLVAVPVVLVLLPEDYLVREKPAVTERPHPVLWVTILAVRNLLGVLALFAGLVMLLTPGQGILTILVGLMLVTVPGKRPLMRRLLDRPALLHAVNRLRARFGRPPLQT